MHTLTYWDKETPGQRTERFASWYDHFVDFEGDPTTITVHRVWENYGGPEEGGWYYQCGEPVKTVCIFSRSQALRVLHELHEKYSAPEYEEDTYDICLSNRIARWYPDRRPHYE